jgi:hypothetical protein
MDVAHQAVQEGQAGVPTGVVQVQPDERGVSSKCPSLQADIATRMFKGV